MELMTIKQVAEFLQISRVTVYNWIASGAITPREINGKKRFIKQEIEDSILGSKNVMPTTNKVA